MVNTTTMTGPAGTSRRADVRTDWKTAWPNSKITRNIPKWKELK